MTGSAAPASGSSHLEVVESWPARIRRPLDLLRLVGLVAGLLVLIAVGVVARDTGRGADADIARLVGHVPALVRSALGLVSAFGALAFPVALMVREVVRGNRRGLLEALLTGFLAIGIAQGLNRVLTAFPSTALYGALTAPSDAPAARPLDTYLTALFAFATVVGVAEDRPWRRLLGGVTAVYVLSAVASTSATLLSLLVSPVLGMLVGIAVRYAAGSVNESPDGARIAAALARQGFPLARLEQVPADQTDHRAFRATAVDRRAARRAGVRPGADHLRGGVQALPHRPPAGRARARAGAVPGAGDRAPLAAGPGRADARGPDAPAAGGPALRSGLDRARLRVPGRRAPGRPPPTPSWTTCGAASARCTPATSPTAP